MRIKMHYNRIGRTLNTAERVVETSAIGIADFLIRIERLLPKPTKTFFISAFRQSQTIKKKRHGFPWRLSSRSRDMQPLHPPTYPAVAPEATTGALAAP